MCETMARTIADAIGTRPPQAPPLRRKQKGRTGQAQLHTSATTGRQSKRVRHRQHIPDHKSTQTLMIDNAAEAAVARRLQGLALREEVRVAGQTLPKGTEILQVTERRYKGHSGFDVKTWQCIIANPWTEDEFFQQAVNQSPP